MAKTSYVENRHAGTVEVDSELELWREVTVHSEDYKGFDVDVTVTFDGERMSASEVKVMQRPNGPPVTGEALRQVAVGAFVRHSIQANADIASRYEPGESFNLIMFGLLDAEDVSRMKEAGPVTETLRWVARIYKIALASGDRPTKAVSEVFEVPGYTATRWVAKTRDKGLLGPAEPGKAG